MKRKTKIILSAILALAFIVTIFTLSISAAELDESSIVKLPDITLAVDLPSDNDAYINLPTALIDGLAPSDIKYTVDGDFISAFIDVYSNSVVFSLPYFQNETTNWGQNVVMLMRDVGYSSLCSEIVINTNSADYDFITTQGTFEGTCNIVYEINGLKYSQSVTIPEVIGPFNLISSIRSAANLRDDVEFFIDDLTLICSTEVSYMEKNFSITVQDISRYLAYSSGFQRYIDVLSLDKYHEGFADGHETSELDLQNAYDTGYNEGYKEGYDKGDLDGYNYAYDVAGQEYQGRIDELQEKYENAKEGLDNSNAVLNFFQGILEAVQGTLNTFFNLEVFGFNLGNIVAILLGALVVIIVIKFII